MSQPGAHVFHQVTHTPALAGMIAGALIGAAVAAAVVATGGLALAVVAGAAGALGGGFLGKMLGSMFTIKTGPIMPPCALTVRYENMPAAKVGDLVMCSGIPFTPIPHPASMIAQGSMTVFVENMPAARQDDMTICGAAIAEGCSSVFIGGATTTAFPISAEIPSLADLSNAAMTALLGVISTVEDIAEKIADTALSIAEEMANGIVSSAEALLHGIKYTVAFSKGLGVGAKDWAIDTVKSISDIAKMSYEFGKEIIINPEFRKELSDNTNKIATNIIDYLSEVIEDPQILIDDSNEVLSNSYEFIENSIDLASANLKQFKQDYNRAVAEGRETEFLEDLSYKIGHGTGYIAPDIAALYLAPQAGIITTGSKLAKTTKIINKIDTAIDSAKKLPIVRKQLDKMYENAPQAKVEIDRLATQISDKYSGNVAKAPLKRKDTALAKVMDDYKGDATLIKDIARNTIIVNEKDIPSVIKDLQTSGAKIKVINATEDKLGYSGVNATITTSTGIKAEIQVNSPKMIYAKEKSDIARSILGDDTYNKIAKETGIPGGKGHEFYEEWRNLPADDPKRGVIEKLSTDYYKQFR